MSTSNQRRRAREALLEAERVASLVARKEPFRNDGHTAFFVNLPKLPPRRARRPLSFWDQAVADAMTAPEATP